MFVRCQGGGADTWEEDEEREEERKERLRQKAERKRNVVAP
jgi:hypothetical protein